MEKEETLEQRKGGFFLLPEQHLPEVHSSAKPLQCNVTRKLPKCREKFTLNIDKKLRWFNICIYDFKIVHIHFVSVSFVSLETLPLVFMPEARGPDRIWGPACRSAGFPSPLRWWVVTSGFFTIALLVQQTLLMNYLYKQPWTFFL